MNQKRHLAASVLDPSGNFWILGGTDGGISHADSTEIYEYEKKQWRKGYPLPSALRDTGLQSHCAVKLNSTHMFVGGGFAASYNVKDTVKKDQSDSEYQMTK